MVSRQVDRRLAAILAADVAGYSRLMGADEVGTFSALKDHRSNAIDPTIASYTGRIVKTTGDGILVEFSSAIQAVECALDIQKAMTERNRDVPPNRRIEFRIGINIGDIIFDSNDVFGDGVNIAARLESIAEPGGVYLSRAVHEQVAGKIAASFTEVGLRNLKNIDTPVHVFRVGADGEGLQGSALPPLISDRPSIAVLPFSSLSENRSLELLADGLVEDVIALLARVPGFFVIARSSSFAYRNCAQDVRRVGRELGVRYVVEGSIRSSDKRARVSIQLIEAKSGKQIWTQRFDAEIAETFDLQDDIARQIIRELEPELTRAELTLIQRQRPGNLDAWSRYRQALGALAQNGWNEEALDHSIKYLRDAIALDPRFALAHAMKALFGAISANLSLVEDGPATQREALRDAEAAVALDPNASEVLGYAGCALSDVGERTRGREWLERAIEIDPSNAQAHVALGATQVMSRELDAGIKNDATWNAAKPVRCQIAVLGNGSCRGSRPNGSFAGGSSRSFKLLPSGRTAVRSTYCGRLHPLATWAGARRSSSVIGSTTHSPSLEP